METGRYHHIFDLNNCTPKIADKEYVESFVREMIQTIGMSILAGPLTVNGIPENPGVTCVVVVDFSHVSVHTFTEPGEALIDIFSCKEYDRDAAEEVCTRYFGTPETEVRHKEVWWG